MSPKRSRKKKPKTFREKLKSAKRIRIISIDGGGLYGLFAGIWMNQLCRELPNFMDQDDENEVHVFSGTSAGAVTSLLATAHPPRDIAFDPKGESVIEEFWQEPGLYTNRENPVDNITSLMMLTAFLGRDDELRVLDKYFADGLTMRDLNPVVASTYNWHGSKPRFEDPEPPPFPWPTDWNVPRPRWTNQQGDSDDGHGGRSPYARPFEQFGGNIPNNPWAHWWRRQYERHRGDDGRFPSWTRPPLYPWRKMFDAFLREAFGEPFSMPVGGAYKKAFWANMMSLEPEGKRPHNPSHNSWPPSPEQSMHPWLFTNFSGPEDWWDFKVRDIAYGATAMPTVRPVRGGIGDGAIFNANPSVDTISALIWAYHGNQFDHENPDDFDRDQYLSDMVECLSKMSMLSIGPGSKMPAYWLENFNLGSLPYSSMPVDPFKGFWPPGAYGLNQPIQDAVMNSHTLLGGNFHRLDPHLMEMPPGPVLYFVRDDRMRNAIIDEIKRAGDSAQSKKAVDAAARFLDSDRWTG